ncbi:hypothetical protein [Streptomyces sp. NPDC058991]|uniref:hypothetical protein n=1 Tax=unclassified Streptomyces TaxID=2593676 RepID=UPI0036AD8D96
MRDHCSASGLELVCVENLNDRHPEEQRADFSLTRFTVTRSESPTVEGGPYRPACRRRRPAPVARLRTGAGRWREGASVH